ncbi:MAG: carbon monoxide dehydrogenase [Burkholderiaceae bacterium]|nr:MAG: carbon monoxide dehydrogenase [Burkholderiaceae bacterium]TAM00270.1 MAG: carbon monoxide dehydrogenase [Pusillimonas sp.]
MDMQGNRQLAVTQQHAWDALNDPEVLKLCIPGCTNFDVTAENQYTVGLGLKIGPVSAKFSGKITLSNIQAPDSYDIAFNGQGGVAGFGEGSAHVTLASTEAGCDLAYVVHATVGGKVAQLGQRLIDGTAKSLADGFFRRFDEEMRHRFPAAAVPAADTAASVAGPAAPIKRPISIWAWVVGVVVVAAVIVWAVAGSR